MPGSTSPALPYAAEKTMTSAGGMYATRRAEREGGDQREEN
jgi:hypothetical protein